MIESISDFLSIAVTVVFTVVGFITLFDASAKHHEENVKKREEIYYRYYDAVSDDSNDDDESGLYFED